MNQIEKEISILREILKDSVLTPAEKQSIWSELERLSNERDDLLREQGVEIQPWDWKGKDFPWHKPTFKIELHLQNEKLKNRPH